MTFNRMHLLWPHYMRPLPAFAMLQFEPLQRAGAVARVARGTPVEARPRDGGARSYIERHGVPHGSW